MNLKEYFDPEFKSVMFHAIAGAAVGYVSFLINNPIENFLVMIAVMAATVFMVKKIFKINQKLGWFVSNGIMAYVFLWLIVWTIFYNIPAGV